ncbi:hypothetical protein O1611_g6830 [Lasiodiplodia mahajangana]|uniref:Uncharacterized protein n=1 Tax=Lasiodiplodia mahajangana TaxID=1108764 RepID=A0ACC2JH70_9PEZI|nr:hypothetical protein O1611_g6830 [Lasiodiplodia mahajangana]
MIAETSASTPPTTSTDGISSQRRYLIPFEEDLGEEGEQQTPSENSQAQPSTNLVFWSPAAEQEEQEVGQLMQEDNDALYLGNYCVPSLKVEGHKARPIRIALQNFIIN